MMREKKRTKQSEDRSLTRASPGLCIGILERVVHRSAFFRVTFNPILSLVCSRRRVVEDKKLEAGRSVEGGVSGGVDEGEEQETLNDNLLLKATQDGGDDMYVCSNAILPLLAIRPR